MKATRFKLIVNGNYDGRNYRYEEEVNATDYQVTGWKLNLIPQPKKDIIKQLNDAKAGDHFVWEEKDCKTEVFAY